MLASARRFFLGLLIAQRAGRPARVPARPAAACGPPSQTGYSITYPLISITDLRPPEISARLSVSRYFLKYSLHTFGGGSWYHGAYGAVHRAVARRRRGRRRPQWSRHRLAPERRHRLGLHPPE